MKELNKLRNTLKEVKEIKESLEELKFGCRIIHNYKDIVTKPIDNIFLFGIGHNAIYIKSIKEIIGNPIQYNHLLWYCMKNNMIYFQENNIITLSNINHIEGLESQDSGDIEIDLTKDLNEQSEETLKSINDFISNI